ncbi:metallophosphoesterase family protein [Balneolales bacterium ANBcel1]|nr:metallophosphoesterase family protein [Balneolales bacterium ANBcel1]
MKVALFSDIHANIDALTPVLKDIEQRKPDAVYCLGDLVGYAPYPNEVVELIRSKGIPVIAGNYDQGVGLSSDDCGCAYKTPEDEARGVDSITYTNRMISSGNRAYLRSLPAHLRLEFGVNGNPWNFLMVHGSPRKINEYLFEDRAEKSMLRMMQKADTHVMAFGHTHKPYHKTIEDESGEIRHAINIGSVGKPKDGDPRACYAMIEWDGDLDLNDKNDLKVEFIRVEYDVEQAAKAVEESPLPGEFADMLRNGG